MFTDDSLEIFARDGAPTLPQGTVTGYVDNEGARIWHASVGDGPPVILLHGGAGHGGNFSHEVPALVAAGYRAIVIDSRGQGHSTRDGKPYSYELMGRDTIAVMDALGIMRAPVVGWSDGACIGLVLAKELPERIAGVFFFACNVDATGGLPFVPSPVIDNCLARHRADYAALSPTPDGFDAMFAALQPMQQSQPGYTADDLRQIGVPVTVVLGESDEFIAREHAQYIARTIPGAEFVLLAGVSHFAPVQRPQLFSDAVLSFLRASFPAS
jgi:pimeloyl-ACP methyl ester carboxylesterase